MNLTSIPTPVVTWETVVSTNDPTREPSRAQIRTLRKNGLVSDGLQVRTRRAGRAAGSHTYHSTLFALALKAGQAGDDAGAKVLRKWGKEIESRFATRIREYLASHTLDALVQAPFFSDLSGATARALDEWCRRGRMDIVFASGLVQGFADESVIVQVKYHRGTGGPVEVDLPRALIESSGLHRGDYVWIFRRTIGSAVLLDILPAILTTQDAPEDAEEERTEGKEYLRTGAGALPTTADAEFLLSRRKRSLPRRVVRPAG